MCGFLIGLLAMVLAVCLPSVCEVSLAV